MDKYYKAWSVVRRTAIKAGLACEDLTFAVTKGKFPSNHFDNKANPKWTGSSVQLISKGKDRAVLAKYNADGSVNENIRVLSSSDFHFDIYGDLNCETTERFCRNVEKEKPDLIVLTGDIIQGKYQQFDAVKFARMMEKLGIYWCYSFGNHETHEEKGFYKWFMMDSLSKGKYSLCMHGKEELFGYSNYHIDFIGKDGKPITSVFCFDSGRDIRDEYRKDYNLPADFNSYDFLKKEQIAYYEDVVKDLKVQNPNHNSLMFMHIPLCEYAEVFDRNEKDGFVPSGKAEILYGGQFEGIGSSKYNSGMFEKIKELNDTKAVYAGHDHVNDWCALYEGVYLVYTQHGGYNSYHMGDKFNAPRNEWKQGVTVTDIFADGTIKIEQRLNEKE